jgi:hypothetical protein
MSERVKRMVQAVRAALAGASTAARRSIGAGGASWSAACRGKGMLPAVGVAGAAAYGMVTHPPLAKIAPGHVGLRINQPIVR